MDPAATRRKRERLERLLRVRRLLDREARNAVLQAAANVAEARRQVAALYAAVDKAAKGTVPAGVQEAGLRWIEVLYEQIEAASREVETAEHAFQQALETRQETWRDVKMLEQLRQRLEEGERARAIAAGDRESGDQFLQEQLLRQPDEVD